MILTAYVEPDGAAHALRLGAAAVLQKPLDLEELLRCFHGLTARDAPGA